MGMLKELPNKTGDLAPSLQYILLLDDEVGQDEDAAAAVAVVLLPTRIMLTTQAIVAGGDAQTPVIEFLVGKADDVAVTPMVINEMQGLVTRHLRCSQPEERLMRIGPMGITRQKIVPGQQGLIVPLPEPTYVPKLLGISDHNDGFRAVEKW